MHFLHGKASYEVKLRFIEIILNSSNFCRYPKLAQLEHGCLVSSPCNFRPLGREKTQSQIQCLIICIRFQTHQTESASVSYRRPELLRLVRGFWHDLARARSSSLPVLSTGSQALLKQWYLFAISPCHGDWLLHDELELRPFARFEILVFPYCLRLWFAFAARGLCSS
jgi:hypothetical protein